MYQPHHTVKKSKCNQGMWKRWERTEVLGWIWKIVRTSGKILATFLSCSLNRGKTCSSLVKPCSIIFSILFFRFFLVLLYSVKEWWHWQNLAHKPNTRFLRGGHFFPDTPRLFSRQQSLHKVDFFSRHCIYITKKSNLASDPLESGVMSEFQIYKK